MARDMSANGLCQLGMDEASPLVAGRQYWGESVSTEAAALLEVEEGAAVARTAEKRDAGWPLCEVSLELGGCFSGWESGGRGAGCLRVERGAAGFESAEAECRRHGAHLVSLTEQNDQKILRKIMFASKHPCYILR